VVIFRFLKFAAAAILDFQNFKLSMVDGFKRVELRRRTKFGRIGRTDAKIWRFFILKGGGRRHLRIFKYLKF